MFSTLSDELILTSPWVPWMTVIGFLFCFIFLETYDGKFLRFIEMMYFKKTNWKLIFICPILIFIRDPLNNQVNKFYCLFLDITKFLIHLVFLSPKINILLSFNLLSFANPDTCVSRLFRKSRGIIISFYSISFKLMQCHSWYQNSFHPEGQKFS